MPNICKGWSGSPPFPTPTPEKVDWETFLGLHKYLEETYPLVHKTLTKEVFGKVGLLYHWKGTGKSGKLPLMLTAHQDVVPEGDHSMWKYPPYEGVIAEGCVWGRGSSDCKKQYPGLYGSFGRDDRRRLCAGL